MINSGEETALSTVSSDDFDVHYIQKCTETIIINKTIFVNSLLEFTLKEVRRKNHRTWRNKSDNNFEGLFLKSNTHNAQK